jgi:hypothetical protein
VCGVVKKKMKTGHGTCKVLCDGDTSQMKSSGTHLKAHAVLDDASVSSDDEGDDAANSDKEDADVGDADMEDDDGMTAGPSGGGMSAAEIAAEEETAHLAPGGGCVSEDNSEAGDPAPQGPAREGGKATTSCHDREWETATNVPDQRERKGRPTGNWQVPRLAHHIRNDRAGNIRGTNAPVVDGAPRPPSCQCHKQQGPQHVHPE